MKKSALIYGFVGLVIGLTIGFWVANVFNRAVSRSSVNHDSVSAKQTTAPEDDRVEKLSPEEIKAAFASSENRKEDAAFQKELSLALYRYSKIQNDSSFLPELLKLLERANKSANEKDAEILIALADTAFNFGQNKTNFAEKARNLYLKAIKLNPSDSNIKTALASTYLFSKPAEPETAISKLDAILKQDPQNEGALQLLVSALIQTGEFDLAEQKLSDLEKINPNNSAIPDLKVQLTQTRLNRNL